MIKIKLVEIIKYVSLYVFLFLIFTVVEIPDGSSVGLLAYHSVIVFFGLIAFLIFNEKITAHTDQTVLWLLFLATLLAYSFTKPSSSLVNIIIITTSLLAGFLASIIANNHKKTFCETLDFLIATNYIAIIIQLITYYAFGHIVDFHTAIFPFSSSHSSEISNVGVVRITGLHNEPGTYSTWVSASIFLRLCLDNKINFNHYIGILSVLLTFSVSGYVYGAMLIVSLIYINLILKKSISRSALTTLTAILIILVVVWYGAYEYLTWRFLSPDVFDGTSNLKIVAIEFLKSSDISRILLGSGFTVNDCYSCESIQDVGLFFNLYFQLGLGSLLVFAIFLCLIRPKNMIDILYLVMLMISKMFIFSTALIAPIYILGAVNRNKRNDI